MIKNIEHYNNEMHKSYLDKMFFMQHISPSVVLDYGCADGKLGDFLKWMKPSLRYIGYDTNPQSDGIYNDRDTLDKRWYLFKELDTAVVFSSVLHEIAHYDGALEAQRILRWAIDKKFKWIVIRDMFYSDRNQFDFEAAAKIWKYGDREKIKQHEDLFGPVELIKSSTHFLLKYRYDFNWEREVKENYFSWNISPIGALTSSGYKIIHNESFQVPFIKRKIQEDFKYSPKVNTHVKFIFERTT